MACKVGVVNVVYNQVHCGLLQVILLIVPNGFKTLHTVREEHTWRQSIKKERKKKGKERHMD
jgi:hypothetical protein